MCSWGCSETNHFMKNYNQPIKNIVEWYHTHSFLSTQNMFRNYEGIPYLKIQGKMVSWGGQRARQYRERWGYGADTKLS